MEMLALAWSIDATDKYIFDEMMIALHRGYE